MERIIIIIILFFISQGCNGRVTVYEIGTETGYDGALDYKIIDGETDVEVEENDIGISDVYYTDEYESDTIKCEQYKCENLIYGRDDVYVDKESGSIYLVEYGYSEMKFSKYDKNGEFIWEKRAEGGKECLELEYVDRDENFYISEYSYVCTPKGGCECRWSMSKDTLIKYRKEGDEYKEVFSIRSSYLDISSIAIDLEGNIYIAGEYKNVVDFGNGVVLDNSDECRNTGNPYNPVECYTDVFVAKFNRDGKALWAKGLEDGEGTSIILYNDFIYFDVRGYTEREEDGKKIYTLPYKIKIVKFDTDGNYKWSRILGQESSFDDTKFIVDKDGSIYLYGLFDLYPDYKDSDKYKNLNIAKFDKNGEFIWGKDIEEVERVLSISIADKSLYSYGIIGHGVLYFYSKIYKDGRMVWYREFEVKKDDKNNIALMDGRLSISDDISFYSVMPVYGSISVQGIDNCTSDLYVNSWKKYLLKFNSEPCDNIEVKIK